MSIVTVGRDLGAAQFIDVPKGFKFPDAHQYATDLGVALNVAQPIFLTGGQGAVQQIRSVAERSLLTPIKAQVAMFSSTFEAATGVSVDDVFSVAGAIAALASQPLTPKSVVGAIRDIIAGGLKIITGVLGVALGVTAAALQSIPVVGTIIGAILAVVAFLIELFSPGESDDERMQRCLAEMQRQLTARCPAIQTKYQIVQSRAAGPTPSDLFRPVAYALFDGRKPLPPTTIASVFVALCASETPFNGTYMGASPETAEADFTYSGFITEPPLVTRGVTVAAYPDSGLPRAVKQQMWTMIKAILSAVEDPNLSVSVYDGGVGAYSLLQELVRHQFAIGKINRQTIYGMVHAINSKYYASASATYSAWNSATWHVSYCTSPCEAKDAKLADSFLNTINVFQKAVFEQFYRDGKWDLIPNNPKDVLGRSVAKPAAVNTIIMNDRVAIKMEARLRAIGLVPPPPQRVMAVPVSTAKVLSMMSRVAAPSRAQAAQQAAKAAAQKAALLRNVGISATALGAGAAAFALLRGL